MATSYNRADLARQRKVQNGNRVTLTNGAGPFTKYYPLDPTWDTTVIITHHASDTPLMSFCASLDSNDDLENAEVLYAQQYAGDSTPFSGVQPAGFTGMKITCTPTNADVEIEFMQSRR